MAADTRPRAILDAALEAFAAKGFSAATVADVRRISGASTGSIYHHFGGGKEHLAAALYLDGLRDYQRGLLRTLRRHDGAQEGIRAIARHHLRWVAANPELARFLASRRGTEGLPDAESDLRDLNRETFAAVTEWLAPHVASGAVKDLPIDVFYTLLIGPAQEFSRHWLEGRMRTSIARAEEILGDAAWDATKGTP
jgi:AcrR family transcriptional regulator